MLQLFSDKEQEVRRKVTAPGTVWFGHQIKKIQYLSTESKAPKILS